MAPQGSENAHRTGATANGEGETIRVGFFIRSQNDFVFPAKGGPGVTAAMVYVAATVAKILAYSISFQP
jgi:hypothetical protein